MPMHLDDMFSEIGSPEIARVNASKNYTAQEHRDSSFDDSMESVDAPATMDKTPENKKAPGSGYVRGYKDVLSLDSLRQHMQNQGTDKQGFHGLAAQVIRNAEAKMAMKAAYRTKMDEGRSSGEGARKAWKEMEMSEGAAFKGEEIMERERMSADGKHPLQHQWYVQCEFGGVKSK